MESSVSMTKISLDDFERFHAPRVRKTPPPVTFAELCKVVLLSVVVSPFVFSTFFLIPMMGQVTVGLAAFVTALYLFFRRSILVAGAVLTSAFILSSIAFMSIQSIKNQLDVTLFILTALGIPVCVMYTVFVGTKIWDIRGEKE